VTLVDSLIGHWIGKIWAHVLLSAALGITIYWPIVCLVAVVDARDATGWKLVDETPYWIVLPLIVLWGVWSLRFILKESQLGNKG
jgi:hypothetical protein